MEEEGWWSGWTRAAVVGVCAFAAGHVLARVLATRARRAPLLRSEHQETVNWLESEQLSRNVALYGDDGMTRIRNAFVVVVGVGGVGSHCATALARSGVGKLRLVDYDQVSVSSLNRHACATRADVGEEEEERREEKTEKTRSRAWKV